MNAWPPALYILIAITAFWLGWYGCRYRHDLPPTPVVWPWQAKQQTVVEQYFAANYGRHAAPADAAGEPITGDVEPHNDSKDDTVAWWERWPDAHLDGYHGAPEPGCMYCTVAALPMDMPDGSEVPA